MAYPDLELDLPRCAIERAEARIKRSRQELLIEAMLNGATKAGLNIWVGVQQPDACFAMPDTIIGVIRFKPTRNVFAPNNQPPLAPSA